MERSAPSEGKTASCPVYVKWEEVFPATSDKGGKRREVWYYLNRVDGGSDLVVIGKEKSFRHMSYVISDLSFLKPPLKPLRSRRDVIDWLDSIISESGSHQSSFPVGSIDNNSKFTFENFNKNIQSHKLRNYTEEFLWLGLPWTCRKRRKHYQSFCRNCVKISVHDFVYVLAEEDKRLVAYLEDMYEDSKGNKLVVVRWFHKIDEVGIVLPHNFNDREIFFSLCLQDLSIECIDGLATVLSPQHFEKFLKEASHTKLNPFVCHKQFENDDVKPFDITQVKGYWKQEILGYMHTACPSKDLSNPQMSRDSMRAEGYIDDASGSRPKKKYRPSKDKELCTARKESDIALNSVDCKSGAVVCNLRGESAARLPTTGSKQNPQMHLKIGSEVEVLCQDSGIRGCWFRACIIKKHKDKVKVRYQDIRDADDEAKKLEEWILASKLAVHDQLGIRLSGRSIIRPSPEFNRCQTSCVVDVGTAVDVWWHDGWWEGIVVRKDSEDRVHVYFLGEKQESVCSCANLRYSLEWFGNEWRYIKDRPDIVSSVLAINNVTIQSDESKKPKDFIGGASQSGKTELGVQDSSLDSGKNHKAKEMRVISDLSKDNSLAQLRWKTSKKRRRSNSSSNSGSNIQKMFHKDGLNSSPEVSGSDNAFERFLISTPLKVEQENCKYVSDSLFSSAVVPSLTSLVMSR